MHSCNSRRPTANTIYLTWVYRKKITYTWPWKSQKAKSKAGNRKGRIIRISLYSPICKSKKKEKRKKEKKKRPGYQNIPKYSMIQVKCKIPDASHLCKPIAITNNRKLKIFSKHDHLQRLQATPLLQFSARSRSASSEVLAMSITL